MVVDQCTCRCPQFKPTPSTGFFMGVVENPQYRDNQRILPRSTQPVCKQCGRRAPENTE